MKFWKKQTDYIIFGLILILLTACSTITKKPDMLSVQSMNNFRKKITKKINVNYLLFLPEGYQDGGKDFPLIMFLHGAGERGKDLNKVKIHGPAKIVDAAWIAERSSVFPDPPLLQSGGFPEKDFISFRPAGSLDRPPVSCYPSS